MRRGLLLGVAILALILVAAGVLWVTFTRSGLPQREGTVRLAGISAPVEVRWNDWGVPHVNAPRATDLAEVVGWLHANDRLTQMELGRRQAAGRLSELVGDAALPSDRYFVSLGFRRIAADYEDALGPESRALLAAYARGVNAWLEQRDGDLPPELRLLGADPEPWTIRDSLYFQLQMAHELSFWQGRPEETRFRWMAAIGPDGLRDLLDNDPHVPDAIADLAMAASARPAGAPSVDVPAHDAGEAAPLASPGSNNWALSPDRTAGGSPIVANDPHLPLAQPGFWYQVQLRASDYEAAGVTLPGLPFVVLGQGPRVAWAFTNVMLDDHDLFFEELDAAGAAVRRADGWEPIRITTESIVRGDGEVEAVTLRYTDRGVLLEADPARGLPARSLTWAAAVPSDAASVFVRFARAGNVLELTGQLDAMVAPAQNLVAGDAAGNILHQPVGRVPDRMTGDGRLPSPGWDPSYGWNGLLPQATNPLRLNPDSGVLVTANHDIRIPENEPAPLTADFDTPHRANRIRELLERRSDWTIDDMAAVQGDVRSAYARELVGLLSTDHTGPAARAVTVLRDWDGAMVGGGAAALFAALERHLLDGIFRDEAVHFGLPRVGGRRELLRMLHGNMDTTWFDDRGTEATESRDSIEAAALERAWNDTVGRFGEAATGWYYPAMNRLTFDHPLSALPVLGERWGRGPLTMSGSATTVAAFGGAWNEVGLDVVYGPSMRWVSDPADPDRTRVTLPTGQSGHPWDVHYDDQLANYLAGRLRPAHWSDAAIEANTVSRLRFLPLQPN